MIRKYTIRLAPRLSFSAYLPTRIPMGTQGFMNLMLYLQPRLWKLFVLFLFPAFFIFLSSDSGSSHLLWLYEFVVVLLFGQIVLRLLGKSDFLPTVSYDLLLLTYTSIVAVSLLLAIVTLSDSFPLWGGDSYRAISGLSLIAYWFIYYLTNVFNREPGMLRRTLELIGFSALMAVVWTALHSIFNAQYVFGYAITDIMIVLIPVWSWLFLSGDRLRPLFGLNLLFSLAMLLGDASIPTIFSVFASSAVTLIIIAISSSGNLRKMIAQLGKDFDAYSEQKLTLGKALNQNAKVIMLGWSVILFIATLLWTAVNRNVLEFTALEMGIESLKGVEGIMQVLFGAGLAGQAGSVLTDLVRSYGLLSFIVFSVLLLILIRDLSKVFMQTKKSAVFAYSAGFLAFIIGTVVYFALTSSIATQSLELHLILFWVVVGLAGVLRSLFIAKEPITYTNELNTLSRFQPASTQRVLRVARLLLALLLILGILYFSNLLFTIQLFITA